MKRTNTHARTFLSGLVVAAYFALYVAGLIPIKTNSPVLWFVGGLLAATVFPWRGRPFFERLRLMFITLGFTLFLSDIVGRHVLVNKLTYRPSDRFAYRWPPFQQLKRFDANVSYRGKSYGDLAAMAGKKEWREERPIRFETDDLGFRNSDTARRGPIDAIVLGDSFGLGEGTSQDRILSTLLEKKYGLRTYNLSLSGGPWDSYLNLRLYLKELGIRKGTKVFWLIFTGNDLDDTYGPVELERLEWNRGFNYLHASLNKFRERSSLKRILMNVRYRHEETRDVLTRTFLNGRRMLFFKPYIKAAHRTREAVLAHKNIKSLEETMAAMKTFAAEEGLDVRLISLPTSDEVYDWVLQRQPAWSTRYHPSGFFTVLNQLARKVGLKTYDLKPFLLERSMSAYQESGELLWWADDTHWNERGNKEVSPFIAGIH
ncbi:MAG: hypothetical protein LHV69_02790 [Elusimicrobia bacterium]|nr:hypothetical protein [Candidatus Obscuribacterium magneticum]